MRPKMKSTQNEISTHDKRNYEISFRGWSENDGPFSKSQSFLF